MQVKRSHTQPVFSQQQSSNPGPTSAPQQMLMTAGEQIPQLLMQSSDIGPLSSPQLADYNAIHTVGKNTAMPADLTDLDSLVFGARSDVGTAVLGMLGFVERISRDCEAMREFLRRGFKSGEDEVERYVSLQSQPRRLL